jgi:hypothetical protein
LPKPLNNDLFENSYHFTAKFDRGWVETAEPQILMHLEKFTLSGECIPREHLISLFSSPSLDKIDIKGCTTLNDNILQIVARIHKFNSLKQLNFCRCHSVTKKGIDVFMNANNSLLRRSRFIGVLWKVILNVGRN